MEYSCIRIDPQSPYLARLAQKYKALRLSALTESPSAFSSTYDIESRLADEWWESRLRLPGRETFICVANAPSGSARAGEGKWAAQVTLLGPVPASSYNLPESAQQPLVAPDDEEEKWQMLSLYTLPMHRGKGVGKMLCREAFRWLKTKEADDGKQQPKRVRVRIMVKPENTATVKLYAGLGFEVSGKCTLAEALKANGDEELVPEDGGGQKYQERTGLIMAATFGRD
ncbi:putative GNAT family acetyltransferase [Macrophomina phaseolina]|uniref:GNAT family acetyltransferase n=1 Tax=Macrophomina phaseolina TaxID=35725 RepID=A0ABQ8FPP6_9PEZI|nr:putative GNAT family acetyltransferase [Macrophomina phaseolina]